MNFTCYHCNEEFQALNNEDIESLHSHPQPMLFGVSCPHCDKQCDLIFNSGTLTRNMGAEGGKYLVEE